MVSLLPTAMLMTAQESRTSRNRNKTVGYNKEKLSAIATGKKWSRVKIRCVQKYNLTSQFGLKSIAFYTDAHDPNLPSGGPIPSSRLLSPPSSSLSSPHHSSLSSTTKHESPLISTNQHHSHHNFKYPSLAPKDVTTPSRSSDASTKPKSKTPRRKLKDSGEEDPEADFEFSGIEKQSRLLHGCLKGKSEDGDGEGDKVKGRNQILDRIAADKDKYRQLVPPPYGKKKLLKRELPKAEVMRDFVESYKKRESSLELSGAARKLSAHGEWYVCVCVGGGGGGGRGGVEYGVFRGS